MADPSELQSRRTLFITSLVGFMVAMEITIISIARNEIAAAFPQADPATLSWVITAYNIGVASLLLPAGWMADRYGRKKVFLWGLAAFIIGSLLSGIATTPSLLIAARGIQSIGGAAQYPAGLALLLSAFPIERRMRAIGVWGAVSGLAAALAPWLQGGHKIFTATRPNLQGRRGLGLASPISGARSSRDAAPFRRESIHGEARVRGQARQRQQLGSIRSKR